jgi:hypothetical protein
LSDMKYRDEVTCILQYIKLSYGHWLIAS